MKDASAIATKAATVKAAGRMRRRAVVCRSVDCEVAVIKSAERPAHTDAGAPLDG
jgi:hypothetical protein